MVWVVYTGLIGIDHKAFFQMQATCPHAFALILSDAK